MTADLVIKGGTVVDGSGEPGARADVAVRFGRISEIGPNLSGETTLDASGCIVSPGFIDIHTHYDAQVFWDPALTPSCFHGVTTVVAGNCGFTFAPTRAEGRSLVIRTLEHVEDMSSATLESGVPWDFESFPEYLQSVERHGSALNFAAYVGHSAVRLFAMGEEAYVRPATAKEVEHMQTLVGEAIDAGAAGLSSSFLTTHRGAEGRPVPSLLANRTEFSALLEVVKERRLGVVSIAAFNADDIAELYELQPNVGVPFTYSALLAFPDHSHRELLELNDKGWQTGAQVWPQVSPRTLKSTRVLSDSAVYSLNPMFGALSTRDSAARRNAYADPAWRRKALEAFSSTGGNLLANPRWDTYLVSASTANPDLIGQPLTKIAAERGTTLFDALLDLALAEPDLGLRVQVVVGNDDAGEVGLLLSQEHCTIGLSDAGAHVSLLCDAPQATDFLGSWIREQQLMSIEEGVRRLSGAQADLFGFADRGYLRPGYAADIAVFDRNTVAAGPIRRVRDFPANGERLTAPEPAGMRHVLVNGTPIRIEEMQQETDVAHRAGHIVRPVRRA